MSILTLNFGCSTSDDNFAQTVGRFEPTGSQWLQLNDVVAHLVEINREEETPNYHYEGVASYRFTPGADALQLRNAADAAVDEFVAFLQQNASTYFISGSNIQQDNDNTFIPYWVVDFDLGYGIGEHNFGVTMVVEAPTQEAALEIAQNRAPGASLLPEDITIDCIRQATIDDVEWYDYMAGLS